MARYRKKRLKNMVSNIPPNIKRDVFVLFIFFLAATSAIAMFGVPGKFWEVLDAMWQYLFGWGWWFWPVILAVSGYFLAVKEKKDISGYRWLGIFLFTISYSGIFSLFIKNTRSGFEIASEGIGGGLLGYFISWPFLQIGGMWLATIVLLLLFCISLLLFFEKTITGIFESLRLPSFSWLKEKLASKDEGYLEEGSIDDIGFEQKEIDPEFSGEEEYEEFREIEDGDKTQKEMFPKSKKILPKIDLPLDLLSDKKEAPTSGNIKINQEIIQKTLEHFGINVEMGEVSVGPTVTQYTFKPASGVKVSQITTLNNDLALALAAHPIRIEAPIPGKSLIGVEVPNQKNALVSLKETLISDLFKNRKTNLSMAIGKDVSGKPWLADLGKMPHLLIAGATGSGKTVGINSIIISLLYQNQPDDLKFIMVDPKRVELPQYNNIPHLLCPVITDVKKTINALRWAVKEMERRLQVLSNVNKRNIDAYNATGPKEKMSYLIIIVDELADLMSAAGPEIEAAIVRLAQMSRAVGIHLVLATQRPSVNVITGLIKANIPARIAFSVVSLMDSRTILDTSGAEKLLGNGDMLFITAELSKPVRLQGAFLSDAEIERVVGFLKEKGKPEYDESITEKAALTGVSAVGHGSYEDDDELLLEAKELVIKMGKASASYLQRKFRIGYARAARLLDLLEDHGIVGPAQGSKPREVIGRMEELEADRILEESEDESDEDFDDDEDYEESER
ncbi:MAG: DNA translocase FtsK 4TM domain-containing protein [Patescibacteria group bacterium]